MVIDRTILETGFRAVAEAVIASTDELTALDQAIGDGDHGFNMKRGFEAVLAELSNICELPLPVALQKAGMQLVMKVGGASGPLYGTLFIAFGKALPENPSRDDFVSQFAAAIDAVKARGKSEQGQKTMLDVLIPVHETLAAGGDLAAVREAATQAAQATVPMLATRGRASFLGERSIGHMDPGARSSEILILAVADQMESLA